MPNPLERDFMTDSKLTGFKVKQEIHFFQLGVLENPYAGFVLYFRVRCIKSIILHIGSNCVHATY